MWYIYILLCDQKIFYVGSTNNLERRLEQHKNGESTYTKKFSDIQLVYSEQFENHLSAIKREAQLKKWSLAKKNALIAGNFDELKKLSKSRDFVE